MQQSGNQSNYQSTYLRGIGLITILLILEGARVAQWVKSLDLTTHTRLTPIRRGFAPGFVNYKKGCTRLAAASDKVYQLLAHGRWFSPASSTTKCGRHDIAEILLKVALKPQKSNQIDLRILITPLVSSNFSCNRNMTHKIYLPKLI